MDGGRGTGGVGAGGRVADATQLHGGARVCGGGASEEGPNAGEEVVRRTVTAELPGGGAQETPWKLGGYPAAGHWSYDSHGSDRPDGEPVVLQ